MVVIVFCKKLTTTNQTPIRWLQNIWWGEGITGSHADAEKAVADNTRNNGKNIRCLIISPVDIHIILAVDFLHFQHSSHFIIVE